MSERVRDAFVYFNCCWKDLQRFNIHCTLYSEHVRCERQRPFLHVFFNENYNYNSFLIQPAFLSFFRLSVCLSLSVCVSEWRWHCACVRLNERHVGIQCAYLLQHFPKWHVFVWLHYANQCAVSAITINEKKRV